MATEKDIESSITLELDGEITPSQITKAITAFAALMNGAHDEMDSENKVKWQVQVKQGSQLIGLLPQRESAPPNPVAINNIYRGLQLFQTTTGVPEGFNERMIQNLQNLCEVAKFGSKKGSNTVKIWLDNKEMKFTQEMQRNIEIALGGVFSEYGSVEGRLLMLDRHTDVNQFAIYEPLHSKKIVCTAGEGTVFNEAYKFFEKRVEVEGMIKYSAEGIPYEIRVDNIYPLLSKEEAPDYKLTRGILKEYV
jgi:hypothetical protein